MASCKCLSKEKLFQVKIMIYLPVYPGNPFDKPTLKMIMRLLINTVLRCLVIKLKG